MYHHAQLENMFFKNLKTKAMWQLTLAITDLISLLKVLHRHHSSSQLFIHAFSEYLLRAQYISMILLVQESKVFNILKLYNPKIMSAHSQFFFLICITKNCLFSTTQTMLGWYIHNETTSDDTVKVTEMLKFY
jgi:hypothetical protein